jgi:hypothetical protein
MTATQQEMKPFPDFTREYLHEGHIIVYVLHSIENRMVDSLFAEIVPQITDPQNTMPLLLVDASQIEIPPYMIRKTVSQWQTLEDHEVQGFIALVSTGYNTYVMRAIIRQIDPDPQKRTFRCFDTREQALSWLETFLT